MQNGEEIFKFRLTVISHLSRSSPATRVLSFPWMTIILVGTCSVSSSNITNREPDNTHLCVVYTKVSIVPTNKLVALYHITIIVFTHKVNHHIGKDNYKLSSVHIRSTKYV